MTARLAVLALLLCAAVALAAPPAPACGCGAMVPVEGEGSAEQRVDEWSVVRFDGARERIEMKLQAANALRSAALIMPVPSRATFSLGDEAVFEEMERRTKPKREKRTRYKLFGGGGDDDDGATGAPTSAAGGGAGGVQVVGTQDLGPLRIVTLRGRRAIAVTRWLEEHGFATPDGLAPIAQDYLDEGWLLVAARLRGKAGAEVRSFQPLVIDFATDEPVYPLRFSKLAPNGSSARVDLVTPWPVAVRDWVDLPDEGRTPLPNSRFFAGPLPGDRYLTSLRFHSDARSPDTDPRFVRAERDDHRRVIVEEQTVALAPYIILAIFLGLVAGGVIGFVRSRRERRAAG